MSNKSDKKEPEKTKDTAEVLEETEEAAAEEQQEQGEDQNAKYLRLMADFQNYKRRTEKEKADIYAYANEKILGEMLDIADNFERALSHEADASEGYAAGMSMIFQNFKGVLERAGLEEIPALGTDFDPNIHNAIMTDANSGHESGKVCEVVQKGYKLNSKVIRPSMVKVAE